MRTIQQYFLVAGNASETVTAGGDGFTSTILFGDISDWNSGKIKAGNEHGECSLVVGLTAASGTPSLTIQAKNLYGFSPVSGSPELTEEDYWTVGTITLSTTKKVFSKMLHITNSDKYDPNADGIQIYFAADDTIDITLNSGRIKRA